LDSAIVRPSRETQARVDFPDREAEVHHFPDELCSGAAEPVQADSVAGSDCGGLGRSIVSSVEYYSMDGHLALAVCVGKFSRPVYNKLQARPDRD
jgi:hypothetical protein